MVFERFLGLLPQAAHCDAPRLSSTWMEMFAAAAGDVVVGVAPNKKQRSRNQFRYHVKSVEIEGHNKSTFEVLLDGVCYGPFQKVLISPVEGSITFPLMSFSNTAE